MNHKRVGIIIFNDIEVLDFCGPFEVLAVTRRDEKRCREEPSRGAIAILRGAFVLSSDRTS